MVAATSTSQAVLLTLDFAAIASDVSGFLKSRAEGRIHIQESFGNSVLHSTCLARKTAAFDVDRDIETSDGLGHFKNLHDDQARSWAWEIVFERTTVHADNADFAGAGTKVNARNGVLTFTDFVVCFSMNTLTP